MYVITLNPNDTLLSVRLYLAAFARLLRLATYDANFEKHKAMLRANANLSASTAPASCICQRMHDTGETGVTHIDRWIEQLNWPSDWFRLVYSGKLDSDNAEEIPSFELARKIKYRIEQNCTAPIHYPDLLADDMYGGRPVFTSLDAEKNAENRLRTEDAMYDAAHPWEVRNRFEYKGSDADADDVLTHQRNDARTVYFPRDTFCTTCAGTGHPNGDPALGFCANSDHGKENPTVQLSFDPSLTSPAERKALSRIRRESEPTAWERQVMANKRRIRSKEEQSRRDLWFIVRREGWQDDPEKIADIRSRVERDGYRATLKTIREGFRILTAA